MTETVSADRPVAVAEVIHVCILTYLIPAYAECILQLFYGWPLWNHDRLPTVIQKYDSVNCIISYKWL